MAVMSRTTYVRGPAKIGYTVSGGSLVEFQSKGDIKVTWQEEMFDIPTDLYGIIDQRISQRRAEITFTPIGEWGTVQTPAVPPFWPLSGVVNFVGTEVFSTTPAVDNTLIITGNDKVTLLFSAVALTKMPDLFQSTVKTAIGQVTFTALGIDEDLWSVANSMWTFGTVGSFTAPAFTSIPTQPYTVAIGSGALAAIETAQGVTTSFDAQTEPVNTDNYGIIGYTYSRLTVTSRFQPVNLSAAAIMALREGIMQGTGAARGKSIIGASDLVVTGAGLKLRVNKVALKNPGIQWGTATARMPELTFQACISTPGTDSFFTISTS